MLITKETDYAIRLLRGLSDREMHTVTRLSLGEQVPRPYAYKILKKLERRGYLAMYRGAEGGCRLAVPLADISYLDLIHAVGDASYIVECMEPGFSCNWCAHHDGATCLVHSRLSAIQRKLERELAACSLQEMIFGEPENCAEA